MEAEEPRGGAPVTEDDVRLCLSVDADPHAHYAQQQNDVPLVRLVRIENRGHSALEELEAILELGSSLAAPLTLRIARLEPGAIWNWEVPRIELDPARLRRQEEREATTLVVRVAQGGRERARLERPLAVLAWNEWGGLSSPPELAAAFVSPNDPALGALLRRASLHLVASGDDGALCGYQRAGRTRAIAAALWRATCELELGYIQPPASFEQHGQKVRFPGRIVEHRLGTCLDLTLFLAAAFEQCGLNPLLVFTQGHAFVGVWERDESFPEPLVEDALRIHKRVELGEILVLETTLLTARPPADFEAARAVAARALADGARFESAICVRAARRRRIRPLAQGAGESPRPAQPEGDALELLPGVEVLAAPILAAAPAAPTADIRVEPTPTLPGGRIASWKRRLLDLSLRNRFLNFRPTRRTIPLACPDLARLEDLLAGERRFELRPRTEPLAPGRDPRLYSERTGEDADQAFLREELEAGALHSELNERELELRLLELYRAARLSLEETGANTLYLALGFLTWTESSSSTREFSAPILLLPMTLERGSVRQAFRLSLADEDPWINVTLLEKLRADFALSADGLDELLEDEAGLDVRAILDRWRRAVRDIDRWRVNESAALGLFSFTKFLMWRDLEHHGDRLREHPVVRHLVERPEDPFDDGVAFTEPRRLDREVPVQDLLLPLDADSSQIAAVVAAERGKSFVLEGPPGTGKSQTITNLVAQCLASGKSVLFVSEKQAALSVVQRRLEQVGLGPFCLELHSNKASKREVALQLGRALEAAGGREPKDWERQARELETLRAQLDGLVDELHLLRPLGRTVFEVCGRLMELAGAPSLALELGSLEGTRAEELQAELERLRDLAAAARDAGDPRTHPLRAVGRSDWRLELPEALARSAPRLAATLAGPEGLSEALSAAGESLGFFAPGAEVDLARRELEDLAGLAELLLAAPYPAPSESLLSEPGWRELQPRLVAALERAREAASIRARLLETWRPAALELDPAELLANLARAAASPWPLSWLRKRRLRAELAPLLVAGAPRDPLALRADLEAIAALRAEGAELADPGSEAARHLEPTWRGGRGDVEALEAVLRWTARVRELLPALAGADAERSARLRRRVSALAREERDGLAAGAPLARILTALIAARARFEEAWSELERLLELDPSSVFGHGAPLLARTRELTAALAGSGASLRDWCRWRAARAQLERTRAAAVLAPIEAGTLFPAEAPAAFERAFLEQWLRRTCDASEALRTFHGGEQRRRIERFRELDRRWIELSRQLVAARLAARIPARGTAVAPASEMGLLLRELKKTRRHLPVRRLFAELPELLPRLKPCVLMSPLSTAQFLGAGDQRFDLVVFDEASQIPVWDAVGAIARGRSTVVVGDSKQLPPTNFFARLEGEDEVDEEDFEELESLLDECSAASLPVRSLAWHYRSRHESLITFSNAHYYGNSLLTFSSPEQESAELGVAFRPVPGATYDRGKSATNRGEAEALVARAVELLASEAAPTLGIVTFSLAQQRLVETLLDERRAALPRLERHFDAGLTEPVFVKNLENVQGDERDVILLGVGYGPDLAGRVAMHFGPLNRKGGERRLNVAITRARRRLEVFASLRSEQLDLSRTQAVGVRHLKTFLDYAERGPRAIAEAVRLSGSGEHESPFEREVAAHLVEGGWRVDSQVGCSGYRIDLGVRHPDFDGRYLMGIECDGATYHSAATARDRDRLRAAVLEGLGWRLERVWSTDWWLDADRERARIEAALEGALAADRARRAALAAALPEAGAPTDGEPDAAEEPARSGAGGEDPGTNGGSAVVAETPGVEERYDAAAPGAPHTPFRPYAGGRPLGTLESLRAGNGGPRVARALLEVVEHEGPIEAQRAARLVAERFQVARTSQQIAEQILATLSLLPDDTRPRLRSGFLWPAALDPDTWRDFRVPAEGTPDPRSWEEVALEELANAARWVLSANVRLAISDLARETARLFGRRLGKNVEARLRGAIESLAARGEARLEGESVSLP